MQQSKPGAKATQQAVENSFRSRNTKVRSAAVPPPNECPTIWHPSSSIQIFIYN